MGSNQQPSWPSSRPHMMFSPLREDEPSSSIPSSSSSFMQSMFRGQDMFQNRFGANSFDLQGAAVSSQLFQAAESSFRPFQPSQPQQQQPFRNEAQLHMPNFNGMGTVSPSQFNNGQSLPSSSVCDQTGYPVQQLIVGAQNRIVAVQRSLDPDVDSTVSQSANSNHLPVMEQPSGSNNVQNMRQSQSEVSTSGGSSAQASRGHQHRDRRDRSHGGGKTGQRSPVRSGGRGGFSVMDSSVSSITGSSSSEADVTRRGKGKRGIRSVDDIVSGEPDTTQTDEDEAFRALGKSYGASSSSMDDRNNHRSNLLLLDGRQQPSSSNNIVDSTQMMANTMRHPVSQSAPTVPSSFMQANVANGFPEHLGLQPTHQSHMSANEIPLSQFTTSELAASASQLVSSMESQLHQSGYNLGSGVDTNAQFPNYLDLDSSGAGDQQPGNSTDSAQNRRKSSRIAELESDTPLIKKTVYEPRPYNTAELWCDDCLRGYDIECDVHRLITIQDKAVFSRAWASLPQCLQIFKMERDENELGVFSKRTIFKRTQFGPFVAELVESEDKVTSTKFPLVVQRDGETLHYETSDENECNWMMFVRPAKNFRDQNVVAYQHGGDIYFTVTRDILETKVELKVGYARHYAERWNKPFFEATEEDLQAMEEQLCKYQCYECTRRFRTTAALQKHLITHDSDPVKGNLDNDEPSSSEFIPPVNNQRKRPHFRSRSLRKKILAAKKYKGESGTTENGGSSSAVFHWKKRSTNIYLNKTLKKYQKWQSGGEVFRKPTPTPTYRPDMMDDSLPDLECVICELTFSNITLLNMHLLVHNDEELDDSKFAFQLESMGLHVAPSSQIQVNCPGCSRQFYNKRDLIYHVAEHGAPKAGPSFGPQDYHPDIMSESSNQSRSHRCGVCFRAFTTLDRLAKHHLCHGDEADKPFQCNVCFKRFINNSALSCHLKTHSTAKYYQCPVCNMGFDHSSAMREHSLVHANANGTFNCPHCDKVFLEFLVLKKHVRGFHTNRSFPCTECEKVFPRLDKLRLHMLRHSTVKEFMCDTCGRLFKRKDKLKEHIKRMHSEARRERDRLKALLPLNSKKFIPKVSPREFHRFIYKCHLCMLGFKRRGMLVNHIAKRHPNLKPESVPELNLPILKTQRDYYCQYCDKVYKSSSKRKSHILKNHPGSELPQSARMKSCLDDIPGVPNPTYSQTVGSITTMPHQCEHCHKQYASKAKLLQHQRKHHPELVPPLPEKIKLEDTASFLIEKSEEEAHDAQAADLLTQAMTELTQSVDFRHISGGQGSDQSYLATRLAEGPPTMVQIQTSVGPSTQTLELTSLSQALQQFAPSLPIQVDVSTAVTSQIDLPITTSQTDSTTSPTRILAGNPSPDTEESPQQETTTQSTTESQQAAFPSMNIVSSIIP